MVAGKVVFAVKKRTNSDQVFCNWFISMDDATWHGVQEVIQTNQAKWHAVETFKTLLLFYTIN